jgi:hypothetical protein
MAKECEICGRSIRTGRKYCWEHRHNSQADSIKGDKLIDEATNSYYHHKVRRKNEVGIFRGLFFFVFGLCVGVPVLFLGIGKEKGSAIFVVFGLIILIFSIFPPTFVYKLFKVRNWEKEAKESIDEKSPEYVSWVKEHVNKKREEKEFKKSLLK